MDTEFDRRTEGERERALMARIRGGLVAEENLDREMLAFPVKLQIQTISPCNAACTMCPWPDTKDVLPQGRMSEEVFEEVLRQIRGRGVERVGLFLMNEPTLDVRLERLTRRLKEETPGATALIFTNGLRLTPDRAAALADSGMDEITVSVLAFDAETYARTMAIDFETVMRNLEGIGALRASNRLGAMKLSVVALDMPGIREGAGAFTRRTGLDLDIKHVTNRAGLVDLDRLGVRNATAPEPTACQRPFVKAYVLYNGDVVLCNCDWMRTTILGNVRDSSIAEIWRGERLAAIRRQHLRRRFDPAGLCAKCDYPYLP